MCRFCQRGISLKHFKKCPNCAELVRNKAVRCRWCRSAIPPDSSGGREDPFAPVPRIPKKPQGENAVALPLPHPNPHEDSPDSD